jgi:hypothetical protein
MNPAAASLLAAAVLALAGCATSEGDRESRPPPSVDDPPGYRVWFDEQWWHVRANGGGRLHRFQGTVSGLTGSITEVQPNHADLRDRVALVGDAVQFDFESTSGEPGFDLTVAGGCVHLDLYLDGKRRPDRIRVGPSSERPPRVPFDRCP